MSLADEIAEAIREEAWRPGATPEVAAAAVLALLREHQVTWQDFVNGASGSHCECGLPAQALAHAPGFNGGHPLRPAREWALVDLGEP